MKIIKPTLSLLLCFILVFSAICVFLALNASANNNEWSNSNALSVKIKPEHVPTVLADLNSAFAELAPKAIHIQKLQKAEPAVLELLLVLPEEGAAAQDVAISKLSLDYTSVVASVAKCNDAPFETINTLKLISDMNYVRINETLAIKRDGTLIVYRPYYVNNVLHVQLNDFDSEKEYSPEDFPQIAINKVEQVAVGELFLTLETDDYFNLFIAATALAENTSVDSINAEIMPSPPPPGYEQNFCVISNTENAEFIKTASTPLQPAPVGIADESGEFVIQGLKPGEVTITYYNNSFDGGPYETSIKIMVIDKDQTPPPPPISTPDPEPITPTVPNNLNTSSRNTTSGRTSSRTSSNQTTSVVGGAVTSQILGENDEDLTEDAKSLVSANSSTVTRRTTGFPLMAVLLIGGFVLGLGVLAIIVLRKREEI